MDSGVGVLRRQSRRDPQNSFGLWRWSVLRTVYGMTPEILNDSGVGVLRRQSGRDPQCSVGSIRGLSEAYFPRYSQWYLGTAAFQEPTVLKRHLPLFLWASGDGSVLRIWHEVSPPRPLGAYGDGGCSMNVLKRRLPGLTRQTGDGSVS